jgi:hypothetical protein
VLTVVLAVSRGHCGTAGAAVVKGVPCVHHWRASLLVSCCRIQ